MSQATSVSFGMSAPPARRGAAGRGAPKRQAKARAAPPLARLGPRRRRREPLPPPPALGALVRVLPGRGLARRGQDDPILLVPTSWRRVSMSSSAGILLLVILAACGVRSVSRRPPRSTRARPESGESRPVDPAVQETAPAAGGEPLATRTGHHPGDGGIAQGIGPRRGGGGQRESGLGRRVPVVRGGSSLEERCL